MTIERFLFLDVDGVLNHQAWYEAQQKVPYNQSRHWDRQIDPECVERVLRLTELAEADIVLSSTWRGNHKTEAALSRAGLSWIDTTPHHHHGKDRRRGNEIQAWMREHKVFQHQIVILDDDSDMVHLMERLVKTDPYNGGFTEAHVERALALWGLKG